MSDFVDLDAMDQLAQLRREVAQVKAERDRLEAEKRRKVTTREGFITLLDDALQKAQKYGETEDFATCYHPMAEARSAILDVYDALDRKADEQRHRSVAAECALDSANKLMVEAEFDAKQWRDQYVRIHDSHLCEVCGTLAQFPAAEQIDQLKAEVERLRSALKSIAESVPAIINGQEWRMERQDAIKRAKEALEAGSE